MNEVEEDCKTEIHGFIDNWVCSGHNALIGRYKGVMRAVQVQQKASYQNFKDCHSRTYNQWCFRLGRAT